MVFTSNSRSLNKLILASLSAFLVSTGAAAQSALTKFSCGELPLATWLESPVPAPAEPIPNFRRVNELTFRSGQPSTLLWPHQETSSTLKYLQETLKIRTIINLIAPETEQKRATIEAERTQWLKAAPGWTEFVHIPIQNKVFEMTDMDSVFETLVQVRMAQKKGRVLIHCVGGKDRTGLAIATLRVLDGCDAAKAFNEYANLDGDLDHALTRSRYPNYGFYVSKTRSFLQFLEELSFGGTAFKKARQSCPLCFL